MTIYVTIEATRTDPVVSHVVDVVRCVRCNGWWHVRYNRTIYKFLDSGDPLICVLGQLKIIAKADFGPKWDVNTIESEVDEWLVGIEQAYGLI